MVNQPSHPHRVGPRHPGGVIRILGLQELGVELAGELQSVPVGNSDGVGHGDLGLDGELAAVLRERVVELDGDGVVVVQLGKRGKREPVSGRVVLVGMAKLGRVALAVQTETVFFQQHQLDSGVWRNKKANEGVGAFWMAEVYRLEHGMWVTVVDCVWRQGEETCPVKEVAVS